MLANDLEFYEGITDPTGPAMTWSMFALGWFELQNYTKSSKHFQRGHANVQRPYNVWSEEPGQSTRFNFLTGAGGFLQSVIFGTSGMRIKADGLHFNPPPPSATGTRATGFIMHSFHYQGARLRQEVTAD